MRVRNNKLFLGEIRADELIKKYGSPLYVYEEDKIKERYMDLAKNIRYNKLKLYYSCKANTNLEILKILRRGGAKLEVVSPGEILMGFKAGFKSCEMIYTCDNITDEELKFLIKNKILINIDSFTQLKKYSQFNPGGKIGVRINQGIGAGCHYHCITGGSQSKFGIYFSEIEKIKSIARQYNLKIIGLHQHIGSGILDEKIFIKGIKALLATAKEFQDLEFIDFGGGFGVPYKPEENPLNIKKMGKEIVEIFNKFCQNYGKELIMAFEPGRYFVAEAGVLLAKVVDIKKTPFKTFIGVDSGFNHLVRPILYGAFHQILNASSVIGPKEIVSVAGNICESGDLFAKDREIAKFKEGDTLAILNAGAYGFSQSSNFNSRPKPAEILVKNGKSRIIRKRQRLDQINTFWF